MSLATFAKKESGDPATKATGKVATGSLRIGAPDDAYEREADRAADEIMAGGALKHHWSLSSMGINAPLQRKCSCGGSGGSDGQCEECKKKEEGQQTVQRKAAGTATPEFAPPIVHEVLNSPGQPLDAETRAFFEPHFGHDFARVRLHASALAAESARKVGALAYTVGTNIAFAPGQYSPRSLGGRRLLAHELAHTIQQASAGWVPFQTVQISEDQAAEEQAHHAAESVLRGARAHVRGNAPARLARQKSGIQRDIPGPSPKTPEEEEQERQTERFRGVGESSAYGRQDTGAPSTWGWGGPETKNLYRECQPAELDRPTFLAFEKTLPKIAGPHRNVPRSADGPVGVTYPAIEGAVPPKIEAEQITENGKSVFKLKPTHAEMPPMRSAITGAGEFHEGFDQCINPDCASKRAQLHTSKFPLHWTITSKGAAKLKEGELEHCHDIREAFDRTLAIYASSINNTAAAERRYSTAQQAIQDAVSRLGVKPDEMPLKFCQEVAKTEQRDLRQWHTANDKENLQTSKRVQHCSLENGCDPRNIIDDGSLPDVGGHTSEEVMGLPSPPGACVQTP